MEYIVGLIDKIEIVSKHLLDNSNITMSQYMDIIYDVRTVSSKPDEAEDELRDIIKKLENFVNEKII